MSKEKLFYVGVKALMENEDRKVLLLRADTSYGHHGQVETYWDIPGGRIEVGQSPTEALKREIEEETSITKIDDISFFTAVISNHQIPLESGDAVGLALMIYRVKIPNGSTINLSKEHDKSEWVDKKEAAKRLADKYPSDFTKLL